MLCRTNLFVFEFHTRIAKIVCRTSFPYGMIFVSLNSNTTGVTGGAGSAYPSTTRVCVQIKRHLLQPYNILYLISKFKAIENQNDELKKSLKMPKW
jgi:hypothetical protein